MRKKTFIKSKENRKINQDQRGRTRYYFHSGDDHVIVTTDLFARTIDVQQVFLVINYDLPPNRENYIHRLERFDCFGHKDKVLVIHFKTKADTRDDGH